MAEAHEVAGAVRTSVGMLLRRLRQVPADGGLTLPESALLARLDRGGPTGASDLARAEQISPQSIGATLAALHARGLVTREPDPEDGRRMVVSATAAGRRMLRRRRDARTRQLARALAGGFSEAELEQLAAAAPLLERLAQSI
jgi:DNA-binding MarR family transcriptional regulator